LGEARQEVFEFEAIKSFEVLFNEGKITGDHNCVGSNHDSIP